MLILVVVNDLFPVDQNYQSLNGYNWLRFETTCYSHNLIKEKKKIKIFLSFFSMMTFENVSIYLTQVHYYAQFESTKSAQVSSSITMDRLSFG
jgi:hypothetical protein